MISRRVFVTTQFEGLHKWPDAPEEVAFLRDLHRHIFHVKLEVEVTHNDRDIEFILLKRWVDEFVKSYPIVLGHMSCEMIAEELINFALAQYGHRQMICTVSEDGENGATITTA